MSECDARTVSKAVQNHVHSCIGGHRPDDDHYCKVCGRYWWVSPEQLMKPKPRAVRPPKKKEN